jgi:hypothetical protein
VSVDIFDNTDYTSIEGVITQVSLVNDVVTFFFNDIDLITERKLIGYSLSGHYEPDVAPLTQRIILPWLRANVTIAQPLNQTKTPPFSVSSPPGGSITTTTNVVNLLGNATGVSIIPVNVTRFRLTVEMSAVGLNGSINAQFALQLFWSEPRLKFVGDD